MIHNKTNLTYKKKRGLYGLFSYNIYTGWWLYYTFGSFLSYHQENHKQKKLAAAVLYYDLKSIEDYLKAESDHVNIRFFTEWQSAISKCSFLEANYVKLLYKIYDSVYDYNYYYGEKEKEGPVKNLIFLSLRV